MARLRRAAVAGSSRRCRVSPVMVDVAGQPHRLAEQGAGFVGGAGVVLAQQAGEGGFGVVGGHADGVGDQFGFLVEQPRVGAHGGERDPAGVSARSARAWSSRVWAASTAATAAASTVAEPWLSGRPAAPAAAEMASASTVSAAVTAAAASVLAGLGTSRVGSSGLSV